VYNNNKKLIGENIKMKQKILKKSFLIISLFVFILVLFLSTPTVSAFDNSDERDGYTISDIKKLISNENQIEVYSEDGTMEIMDEPLSIYNEDSTVDLTNLRASTSFEEVKIVDSGKPDSESIVVTLMGDGFTATEQNNFINAANNAANYLIGNDSTGDQGFYPYNLFRDYFTIYAIKVISEESGVSRDANTNNGHIVNNYFGSSFYYGNNSSTTQRALVITKDDKARALEKSGSSMTAIICNSSRWGGTGGEFAVLSMHTNFGKILTHEFGHSFGGLADEYWYEGEPFRATEAVNKTQNGNLNTIKWKHWIGKSGIPPERHRRRTGRGGRQRRWGFPRCRQKSGQRTSDRRQANRRHTGRPGHRDQREGAGSASLHWEGKWGKG
jgi:hypothetical protein